MPRPSGLQRAFALACNGDGLSLAIIKRRLHDEGMKPTRSSTPPRYGSFAAYSSTPAGQAGSSTPTAISTEFSRARISNRIPCRGTWPSSEELLTLSVNLSKEEL
jgi:hypothetical protein